MRITENCKPIYVGNKAAFMAGLSTAIDYNFGLPYEPPKDYLERMVFEMLKRTIDLDRERTAQLRAKQQKRWNSGHGNREA